MSRASEVRADGPRTYGNFRLPRASGIGKLSFGATLGAIGGLASTFFMVMVAGLVPGLVVLTASAAGVAAAWFQDRHGYTVIDRMVIFMRFRSARRSGRTVYRSGPTQPTKGTLTLPGILGGVTLSEGVDAYDRPFTMVDHPDGTIAVPMQLSPTGTDLLDENTVDHQVAAWGLWLADLSGELGIVQAGVTVETVPDGGARLAREVRGRSVPDAPPIAHAVLEDIVDTYRTGAAVTRTYLTLVFDPRRMIGRARRRDVLRREIASRLPGLTQTLPAAGAGSVHLLTPTEVCRLVRVAVDPAAEVIFEDAALRGEDVHVSWGQAGPISAETAWDAYHHDSGHSRSWVMSSPPRGIVQSGVLRPLLGVARDVERKRITILYKVIDAARSGDEVERDINRAQTRVEAAARRPSARALAELRAASQVAAEEASGAALVDFGVVVTATCTDEAALADTSAAVGVLASSSRLQIRCAYGMQDSAFAVALPLGARPARSINRARW